MKTVSDLLRDADPLRHDPHRFDEQRDRLRRAVVGAAPAGITPPPSWFRTPAAALAGIVLIVIAIVAVLIVAAAVYGTYKLMQLIF